MSQQNEFLATLLRRGGKVFAAYAANELVSSRHDSDTEATTGQLELWKAWLFDRMEEFSAALSAGKPELFARQACWASSIAVARGMTVQQLQSAMACLERVLLDELPETTRPLASEYLSAAHAAMATPDDLGTSQLAAGTPAGRLAATYLLSVLDGDRQQGISVILDAADNGWSSADLCSLVLAPAQCEIGRMWLNDEIMVAEEHFATTTTKMVLSLLHARAPAERANGKTVVVAAVPGNQHDVGLQMIADSFETHGWRTISLGANVPIADLVQATEAFEADLLVISAALTNHLPVLRDSINAVRHYEPTRGVKILVGGTAFQGVEDLATEFGADSYASNVMEAIEVGNRLVGAS